MSVLFGSYLKDTRKTTCLHLQIAKQIHLSKTNKTFKGGEKKTLTLITRKQTNKQKKCKGSWEVQSQKNTKYMKSMR